MKLNNKEEIKRFLNYEKFFSPETESYCLGKSLNDAADIIQEIILNKEEQGYVGDIIERVFKNRSK